MIPQDQFNKLTRMALHQGWYVTRQHMLKNGYSMNAVATILTAVLWEMGGTCSLDNFMI